MINNHTQSKSNIIPVRNDNQELHDVAILDKISIVFGRPNDISITQRHVISVLCMWVAPSPTILQSVANQNG